MRVVFAQRLFYKRLLWNLGHKELTQNIPFDIHPHTEETVAESAGPVHCYTLVIRQQFNTNNSPRSMLARALQYTSRKGW